MSESNIYDANFFARQAEGSYQSAKIIIPLVLELIKPHSVVDIGCGLGTWLKAFAEQGAKEILGIDGDYIDIKKLYIPAASFLAHDLSAPLLLNKKFDLAISLEVAEHLPADKAELFIRNLTTAADIILFSAAIPGQGDIGIGHENEQWPEYWQNLFRRHGYELLDPFRAKLAHNQQVDWWYRQNIMLAVKTELLKKSPFKTLPVYHSEHQQTPLKSIENPGKSC